ncbi:MAG: antitoxin Xre-like helix-turn-helix domain-containing protein [Bacteroidota bacterium]|nr:antitoxin Xre-like helix-turn-helix domain-containing protein [Bacteroidota bacterium]
MKKYTVTEDEILSNNILNEPHPLYYIQMSQTGLPFDTIQKIQERMGFTNKEVSHILHISETSYQRLNKKRAVLDADASEKTIELTELIKKGKDVFGSIDIFRDWLYETNFALGNKKPIDLLSSSIGTRYVMTILNRIEWGIYS